MPLLWALYLNFLLLQPHLITQNTPHLPIEQEPDAVLLVCEKSVTVFCGLFPARYRRNICSF